jgi:tetratricopeptide (TPR) repeat protein
MNTNDFTYLLNKPDAINDKQIIALEKVLEEFPYFQGARSLYLKGLYNQDSFKYNQALKNTAAYTTDRTILFDFITSDHFVGIQRNLFEEKEAKILDINVIDSKNISVLNSENLLEKSIISSINVANEPFEKEIIKTEVDNLTSNDSLDFPNNDKKNDENLKEKPEISSTVEANLLTEKEATTIKIINPTIEDNLEIGKPFHFSQTETHSFQEWLQLSKLKPIVREENNTEKVNELNDTKKIQLDIIDKFIEANPKIPPVNKEDPLPTMSTKTEDTSYLMTETLAKVYLEQKKYQKAIQAYEILILKYPEKSSFFANRILDIKRIQQNNNN